VFKRQAYIALARDGAAREAGSSTLNDDVLSRLVADAQGRRHLFGVAGQEQSERMTGGESGPVGTVVGCDFAAGQNGGSAEGFNEIVNQKTVDQTFLPAILRSTAAIRRVCTSSGIEQLFMPL
jgi:hypothetical protein